MVARNKVYGTIERYRDFLNARQKLSGNGATLRGVKTKNRVLDFYLKNGRWPNRRATNKREKTLATCFENYVSKEAASYDPHFRRLAMAAGRGTNNKRKHDIPGNKKKILEFIKTNGRTPSIDVKEEKALRHKLNYYTQEKNDMTFLGEVYEVDKCHRSGIYGKYRKIINEALADSTAPLIRLV